MDRPLHPPSKPRPGQSIADLLVDRLLQEILRGRYGPGARLPAERELVAPLGASRVSVRQALQRLAEWSVIAVRRGSGVVVRDRRAWSFEVLPAYLRHVGSRDAPSLRTALSDVLALRRALVLHMVAQSSGRFAEGSLAPAREAVLAAWESRGDLATFVARDLEMSRLVLEAAGMFPALWLLNNLAHAYRETVEPISAAAPVPDDYVAVHLALFAALERADTEEAAAAIGGYLTLRFDRQLTAGFEALAGATPGRQS